MNFWTTMFLLVLWLALSGCAKQKAIDELTFKPAAMGNGPIFFLVHPEYEGRSASGPERHEVLYVFDPARHEKPQAIWTGPKDYHGPVCPIQRIHDNVVLIEYKNRNFLVDLSSGRVTPLAQTDDQTVVVGIEGSKIFFLQRTIPNEFAGMSLETQNGKTVVKQYYRPRDRVLVRDATSQGSSKVLGEVFVEKVLAVEEDGFWVITSDEPRKVARIARDGTVEEFAPFDSHWIAEPSVRFFSPGRDYLALSTVHDRHDFHSERELMVIDLRKKELSYSKSGILVDDSLLFGGGSATLVLEWMNDTILSCDSGGISPKRFFVNAQRRTLVDETDAARLFKSKQVPASKQPERKSRGRFELEFGRAYFAGDTNPVASVLDATGAAVRELAVSAEGDWAAYCDPDDSNTYLVDGTKRKKSMLLSGWSYNLRWLPSSEAPVQPGF